MDNHVRKIHYNQNGSGMVTIPKKWLDIEKPSHIILTKIDDLIFIEVFRGVAHESN